MKNLIKINLKLLTASFVFLSSFLLNNLLAMFKVNPKTSYELMQEEDALIKSSLKAADDKLDELVERFNLINFINQNKCEDFSEEFNQFLGAYEDEIGNISNFNIDDIKTDKGYTLLKLAVINGASDCVTDIVRHGADLNMVDSNGDSYLILAVKHGHLNVVKALLSRRFRDKFDINYVNPKTNLSALKIALENRQDKIVNLLLDNGAINN